MTRRSGPPADSLELLLDTICNTFGGIIFIALLVVVLLMISGQRVEPQMSPEKAIEAVAERNELENLQRLKDRLKVNLQKQIKTISILTHDDLPRAVNAYQEELVRNIRLNEEIPELQQKIQQSEKEEQDILRKKKELQPQLASLESQAAELRQSIADGKAARRKTLRMPVLHPPGIKDEVLVVIQFHRLYFWHVYSSSGDREGLNIDDFLILSETDRGVVTSPNPIAGIVLDSSIESQERIARALRRFRPTSYYLAVVVRPDSYGAFQQVREVAVKSGLEYRLIPTTSEESFVDRGGQGGMIQ